MMVTKLGIALLLMTSVGCASLDAKLAEWQASPEYAKACVGSRIALTALEAVKDDPALQDPDVKAGFDKGMMVLRLHQGICPQEMDE